jgi:hypothetical protein
LAIELLKYCAFVHYGGGLYLDSTSPLVDTFDHILFSKASTTTTTTNMAVLNDAFLPRSIHGALLRLQNNDNDVAKDMLQILLTTSLPVLESSPLLLAKSLYDLIAAKAGVGKLSAGAVGDDWFFLQHSCTINPLGGRQVTAPVSNYALNSYR